MFIGSPLKILRQQFLMFDIICHLWPNVPTVVANDNGYRLGEVFNDGGSRSSSPADDFRHSVPLAAHEVVFDGKAKRRAD
jgi:hypothetical protein